MLHAQHRGHVHLHVADALKAVCHMALLGPQGGLVGHVPAGAAAAAGIGGTVGLPAVWGGNSRWSHQATEGKALLLLDNAHQPLLAGEQPRHEYCAALVSADALHLRAQCVRPQGALLIFMHENLRVLRCSDCTASIVHIPRRLDKRREKTVL